MTSHVSPPRSRLRRAVSLATAALAPASLVLALGACIPVGAITTATNTRATPYDAPGMELHAGIAHGTWASEIVGTPPGQLQGAFPVAQLGGGLELWNDDVRSVGFGLALSESHWDPAARYRQHLNEQRTLALGVAAWGTRIADRDHEPGRRRFEGGRFGGEAVVEFRFVDVQVGREDPFLAFGLSTVTGASLSAVTLAGTWCTNAAGEIVSCETDPFTGDRPGASVFRQRERIFFLLPAAHAGLAIDVLDGWRWFPGLRVVSTVGVLARPLVSPDTVSRETVAEVSFSTMLQLRYALPGPRTRP